MNTRGMSGGSYLDPMAMEPEEEFDGDDLPVAKERGFMRRNGVKMGASLIAVAGFCGAAAYGYVNGPEQGGETVVPVIMAKAGAIKEKPVNPGGAKIPHRDKTVYETIETGDKKEIKKAGAVPPEVKKTDVVPAADGKGGDVKATAKKGADEPELKTPPIAKTSVGKAPTDIHGRADPKARKQVAAKPKRNRNKTRNRAVHAKRYSKPPYAVPARGLSTVDIMGPYRVQLGTFRSPVAAQTSWFALKRRHRDVLGPLYVVIERINLGPRGIRYRLQAGPLQTSTDVQSLCSALSARRIGCIQVKG
jgi:hypothetical protein